MDSRKTYAVLCAVMNRETHRTYQFDKFCTYLPLSLSVGKLMLFYVLAKAGLLLVVAETKYIKLRIIMENNRKNDGTVGQNTTNNAFQIRKGKWRND